MFARKPPVGGYILFFALGAVTGAAVALLLAPMSGRKMQKRVGEVTDKVIGATDKALDKMEENIENVQHFMRKIAKA